MNTQKTWWGSAFIDSLEGFIDPARLQRGRAYRTDNRVLKFDIVANKVTATIRGNINPYFGVTKEPRYKVSLTFGLIAATQWQHIITNLCSNPGWLAKLMLNEMPTNIEDAFETTHFLPKTYTDIKASCDCPDDANPCKHIAGVYYRIAASLDSNPMLLFQFRGLAATQLHSALKKTELGQVFSDHISAPEQIEVEQQPHKYHAFKINNGNRESVATQQNRSNRYWSMAEWDLPSLTLEPSEIQAALIKKQGDHPQFWPRSNSFVGAMEDIYSSIKKKNKDSLK